VTQLPAGHSREAALKAYANTVEELSPEILQNL
jgi:hypothetical protein